MTYLNARNRTPFDASNPAVVQFGSEFSHSSTSYVWNTPSGDRVFAYGTGITVDARGHVRAGAINLISIDLDRDAFRDVTIILDHGDPAWSLIDLVRNPASFWNEILSGTDELQTGGAVVFGDELRVENRTIVAARDNLHGAGTLIGDVDTMSNAQVTGGDDTIHETSGSAGTLIGDVRLCLDSGVPLDPVVGGLDVVSGNNGADTVVGDIARLVGSVAQGEEDRISGFAGNDILMGDFDRIESSAANDSIGLGCDDMIHGHAGNDTIYGDWRSIDATSEGGGGNDILFGDAGDDIIFGDGPNSAGGGDDAINGGDGNDTLDGQTGDDLIIGGAGNDTIEGGPDEDELAGGAGDDLFVFRAGSDGAVINDFKASGADRIDLRNTVFDFQDIQDVYDQATTVGTTTTIDLGGGDSVHLLNIADENTLVAGDFIF
jgi:Ca2+-binding RTX toxin-like protein